MQKEVWKLDNRITLWGFHCPCVSAYGNMTFVHIYIKMLRTVQHFIKSKTNKGVLQRLLLFNSKNSNNSNHEHHMWSAWHSPSTMPNIFHHWTIQCQEMTLRILVPRFGDNMFIFFSCLQNSNHSQSMPLMSINFSIKSKEGLWGLMCQGLWLVGSTRNWSCALGQVPWTLSLSALLPERSTYPERLRELNGTQVQVSVCVYPLIPAHKAQTSPLLKMWAVLHNHTVSCPTPIPQLLGKFILGKVSQLALCDFY